MIEKIIGPYTIQIEEVLDPEGEFIYYKVHSPLFTGRSFRILSEDELTEGRIVEYLEIVKNFQ
jgi:hypothetical protein